MIGVLVLATDRFGRKQTSGWSAPAPRSVFSEHVINLIGIRSEAAAYILEHYVKEIDAEGQIRGRLMLWGTALFEAHLRLLHAKRQDLRVSKLREAATGSEATEDVEVLMRDCREARDNARLLAIVYFCQVLNQGRADPGKVAAGDVPFRN